MNVTAGHVIVQPYAGPLIAQSVSIVSHVPLSHFVGQQVVDIICLNILEIYI